MKADLLDVRSSSPAEARPPLDRPDEFGVTLDIVCARVEPGDAAYERLLPGPTREVLSAVRECKEGASENLRAIARAG